MRREAELVGCNGRVIRRKSIRERQRCSSAGGLVAVQDEYAWWSVLRLGPAAAGGRIGSRLPEGRRAQTWALHTQARTGIEYIQGHMSRGGVVYIHTYEDMSSRNRASNAFAVCLEDELGTLELCDGFTDATIPTSITIPIGVY